MTGGCARACFLRMSCSISSIVLTSFLFSFRLRRAEGSNSSLSFSLAERLSDDGFFNLEEVDLPWEPARRWCFDEEPPLREEEASDEPSSSENMASIRRFFLRMTLLVLVLPVLEADGMRSVVEGRPPPFFFVATCEATFGCSSCETYKANEARVQLGC